MAKATKIILGKRPQHFTKTVESQMLDGSLGCIEVKYKYRTRREFAELADALQASLKAEGESRLKEFDDKVTKAKEAGEPLPELSITQGEIARRQDELNVTFLMDIMAGWNLDEPFTKEKIEELVVDFPAMVTAIKEDYQAAVNEGRLGN